VLAALVAHGNLWPPLGGQLTLENCGRITPTITDGGLSACFRLLILLLLRQNLARNIGSPHISGPLIISQLVSECLFSYTMLGARRDSLMAARARRPLTSRHSHIAAEMWLALRVLILSSGAKHLGSRATFILRDYESKLQTLGSDISPSVDRLEQC